MAVGGERGGAYDGGMPLESTSIRVNFTKPFPVFPHQRVLLLPHAMQRLVFFEPRYTQMMERVLDDRGQIALAVFEGDRWRREYHGNPPVREAVCVGQIEQHERMPDGSYLVLLHGVCRARIREEFPPDGERLYREARVEPLEPKQASEVELEDARETICDLLEHEPLNELVSAKGVVQQIGEHEIPPSVLFELVALSVLNESRVQYELLAEGSAQQRGEIIERELWKLRSTLNAARRQYDPDAPEGLIWN